MNQGYPINHNANADPAVQVRRFVEQGMPGYYGGAETKPSLDNYGLVVNKEGAKLDTSALSEFITESPLLDGAPMLVTTENRHGKNETYAFWQNTKGSMFVAQLPERDVNGTFGELPEKPVIAKVQGTSFPDAARLGYVAHSEITIGQMDNPTIFELSEDHAQIVTKVEMPPILYAQTNITHGHDPSESSASLGRDRVSVFGDKESGQVLQSPFAAARNLVTQLEAVYEMTGTRLEEQRAIDAAYLAGSIAIANN